jgi:hypothetical protein
LGTGPLAVPVAAEGIVENRDIALPERLAD